MANTVYQINKGINNGIEFKGLRAQFIWYLGGGLLALLVLFAILYIAGVNPYVCVLIAFTLGGSLFVFVYRLNNRYGQYGMMRKRAQRAIPKVIRCNTRSRFKFQSLKRTGGNKILKTKD